jgi:transposase
MSAVFNGLRAMTPEEREVAKAYAADGMTVAQVASTLGVSEWAVTSSLGSLAFRRPEPTPPASESEAPVARKPAVWSPEARAAAAERARAQAAEGRLVRRRAWTDEEKAAIGARTREANARKRAAQPSGPAVPLQPEAPDVTPLAAGDEPVTAEPVLVSPHHCDCDGQPWCVPHLGWGSLDACVAHDHAHVNTGSGEAQAMAWSEGHTEGFIEGTTVDTVLVDRYIETLIRRLRHEVAPDVAGVLMDRIERLLGVAP